MQYNQYDKDLLNKDEVTLFELSNPLNGNLTTNFEARLKITHPRGDGALPILETTLRDGPSETKIAYRHSVNLYPMSQQLT